MGGAAVNPLTTIRQGPFWGTWPTAWVPGLAYALTTRGDKAVGEVIVNLAKMQKALEVGLKDFARIADRVRQVGRPTVGTG